MLTKLPLRHIAYTICPVWKLLSVIFMLRRNFQSGPPVSAPLRRATTAPGPVLLWLIPRNTDHLRTSPPKATWSSRGRESYITILRQFDSQSLISPPTILPSPSQSQTKFTCTRCTSVSNILMAQDATLSRRKVATDISWFPTIAIPTQFC